MNNLNNIKQEGYMANVYWGWISAKEKIDWYLQES